MFMEERHQKLSETIAAQGKITIAEIKETYGISDESARRDLRILEQRGLCKRTHGGAIAPTQVRTRAAQERDYATMPVFANYRAIARAAAAEIAENDVVYLCGGSFGRAMLEELPRDRSYTLVVNCVDLAKALRGFENVETYLAGGRMRASGSIVDSMAAEFVRRLHFDRCFLTGSGLTAAFGLSNGTDETAAFQRAVLANSRRRTLLMPGAKLGRDAFVHVCPADTFDAVITDREAAEDQIAALEELGVLVAVAEEA